MEFYISLTAIVLFFGIAAVTWNKGRERELELYIKGDIDPHELKSYRMMVNKRLRNFKSEDDRLAYVVHYLKSTIHESRRLDVRKNKLEVWTGLNQLSAGEDLFNSTKAGRILYKEICELYKFDDGCDAKTLVEKVKRGLFASSDNAQFENGVLTPRELLICN